MIRSVGFPFVGDSPFRRSIGRKNNKTICQWFYRRNLHVKKKFPAWNIPTDFYSVGDIVIYWRLRIVDKVVGECLKYPYLSQVFFALFCASYQKSRNLLHATKNYISKHNFLSKKNHVLFSMLPSCRMIFPHPPRNSIMLTVLVEFVLCINN